MLDQVLIYLLIFLREVIRESINIINKYDYENNNKKEYKQNAVTTFIF